MVRKNKSKNVWHLGASSLFNDLGSEMITPLLPFYITTLGGGGIAVGLLSGLREGLSGVFKIFGGWFSEKTGRRKPFIFAGYFLSIIFRFFLIFVKSWQGIIALISMERSGKLRDAPRDALIADSVKKKGKSFGLHQMLDTSGGILGTILVIFLLLKFQLEIKTIILLAAMISIPSLIPILFVKEVKFKPSKRSLISGIRKLDPKLKYFTFVTAIFTLANFGLYMFLLLRAKDITGNIITPLILYIIFSIFYAFFVIPFGILSDKIGRKKVLLGGYILLFFVSLSFIYFSGLSFLVMAFAIYGLVYAITQSNQRAFAADLAGKMKGTAIGTYHSIVGLAHIPAGLIAGYLWNINYSVMFAYISIMTIISSILLLFVKEKKEAKNRSLLPLPNRS